MDSQVLYRRSLFFLSYLPSLAKKPKIFVAWTEAEDVHCEDLASLPVLQLLAPHETTCRARWHEVLVPVASGRMSEPDEICIFLNSVSFLVGFLECFTCFCFQKGFKITFISVLQTKPHPTWSPFFL